MITGIATALVLGGSGLIWAVDWHQEVKANVELMQVVQSKQQINILELDFYSLDRKRNSYGLTKDEYRRWCKLGLQLKMFARCPAGLKG